MKLNKEEKEILSSYEAGKWNSVSNFEKEKKRLSEYARATLRKDKRVNIRITNRDLNELQRKAVKEGLPYQTFISSVLHKFVNGNFIYKPTH